MDQYNDAVQHPNTAFSDASLKTAKIAVNGMGLPVALGGGFALTYSATASGKKYAIRCFHKEAKGLESRYGDVAKALKGLSAPYFIGFEYQPTGVMVNGAKYPIVKMDWVEGDTLGSYLEDNYKDKAKLTWLAGEFDRLEQFLRSKNIAHGDLQNGNVLVGNDVKLIDYDGLYVPAMARGQGTELGHKHFQHPKRTSADFGPDMDRFSFIVIDLSLRALMHDPKLFDKHSNGENIILTANDFLDPVKSTAFADLKAIPSLATQAENLAKICLSDISKVPSLDDFRNGRNIPNIILATQPVSQTRGAAAASYIGAFDVVDGASYTAMLAQVGNKIELVGRITRVHAAKTKYGRPYCFIFFNESKQGVRVNIWSDGLKKLASAPTESWVGAWLSVQGLVDPPYTSTRYGTSLSITITSNSQLRKITATEAKHRLASPKGSAAVPYRQVGNQAILASIAPGKTPTSLTATPSISSNTASTSSRNKAILASITPQSAPAQTTGYRLSTQRANPATSPTTWQPSKQPSPTMQSQSKKTGFPWWLFVIGFFVLMVILAR
ncbi:protein kinase family protein [Rhizobium bangladeshense]|uniref:serine/threonine protein kinase n=1 Tax=Rhizobium bangladeshense TaxID=1138189 RepID=UPI001C82C021|nr:serine/threonine protein kinase [Rhizobium bangladeshense]MBX4876969.1 protein kinase family protein [Rhizobium bangladeshense]